jgi:hypothetical protein
MICREVKFFIGMDKVEVVNEKKKLGCQVPRSMQQTSPSQMVSQRTKVQSPARANSARNRQLSPLQVRKCSLQKIKLILH